MAPEIEDPEEPGWGQLEVWNIFHAITEIHPAVASQNDGT